MIENGRVQLSELGEKSLLGEGGEGKVYSLDENPIAAYKEYAAKDDGWRPHEAGYNALRRALNEMPEVDREFVLARTAWPETAVFDGTSFVGILMRKIPETFMCSVTVSKRVKTLVRDCTFLIYPEHIASKGLAYDFSAPPRATLLSCALAFAETAEVLHRHQIVMGDISGSNAAWQEGDPAVIIFDCDSFSTTSTRPICVEKETPGWNDPLPHAGTNLLTDSYKIGLILYRILTGTETDSPSDADLARFESTYPEAPNLRPAIERCLRATDPHGRPTASEWVAALGGNSELASTRNAPSASHDFPCDGDIWLDGSRWVTLREGRQKRLIQIPKPTLPLLPVIVFGRHCQRPDPNDPGISRVASGVVTNPKPASSPQTAAPQKRKFRPLT